MEGPHWVPPSPAGGSVARGHFLAAVTDVTLNVHARSQFPDFPGGGAGWGGIAKGGA